MSTIKFVSWNICGIGSQAKQLKVINHLLKIQADICLLQETHLTDIRNTILKSTHFPHILTSNYNSRQRGVAIMINNKIKFNHNNTILDPEGRYIVINISIDSNPLTIVNLYGPTNDDPSFFTVFSLSLKTYPAQT